MDFQTLVSFSEKLHTLADSNHDLFEREIEQFKRLNSIDSPQQLAQTCTMLQDQNRLMNIGIVGRVKAGKSSLLNALVFNGESILPKAATPMTAALTTITWGETFHAEVEFYSEADIAAIRNKSTQFEQRLIELENKYLNELIKRRKPQNNDGLPDASSLEEKEKSLAKRKALNELQKEEGLFAAYDQLQRMSNSKIDATTLHLHSAIQADNPQDLAAHLRDYVGADGKYMPFTKTVHIAMPLESLRDICIIDTPGMNDPVQSREERTVKLLKTCDVVFIISPAGQFLNEQDLEVMGRITLKEGVQELVLIASQVDTQLYGSEKRARLNDALESIRHQLATRAKSTLTNLKTSNPEVGSVFDNLIHSVDQNLLHSSGLCHSLNRRFNAPEGWDSNEHTTWNNLSSHYPDYFNRDNAALSLNSLESLANIDAINAILVQVREKKTEITRKKITHLLTRKQKSLEGFKALIISLARNQISQVKSANVEQLEQQLASLELKRMQLSTELNPSFTYLMTDYRKNLRQEMNKTYKNLLGETQSTVKEAKGYFSETKTVDKPGAGNWLARKLWGGGTEERTTTQIRVISSQVVSNINDFINNIQEELKDMAQSSHKSLDTTLAQALTPKIREILGQDANPYMIRHAILSVVASIPNENFDLDIALPDTLKSQGTLKGDEAERFQDNADDFINSLGSRVQKKISSFISDIEYSTPSTISDSFTDDIERSIHKLKGQVNNEAQVLERLDRLVRQAEGVNL